jgi:drug/metabolite transporter (DMT)-like permease
MSTTELTGRQKAVVAVTMAALLVVVLGVGLLLQERGPGNMGTGFLVGAGVAVLASLVVAYRVTRNPDRATTVERALTQHGDEREDRILTRALAVLGLLAVPLTGIATVAIGLGAEVPMVLFLLLVAQVLVGAVAFGVIARRS